MTQHTPGPWLVYIQKNGGDWDYDIRTVKPHNPAGEIGIHVASPNKYLREVEANAALIAAAPDLLAALEKAVAYENAFDEGVYPPWYRAACAAIARAKGEQA